MTNSKVVHQWIGYFEDIGLKDEYIEEYSFIIDKLSKNNVPIIFEIEHLSKLVGINVLTLYSMIFSSENFYRSFKISQKNGKNREITTPFKSLKSVQSWIYKNILQQGYIHKSAHGFVKKKSIKSNAHLHKNSNVFLQLDIKNFFPSIPLAWIINYFNKLGYSKKISFYLAKLCCYNGFLCQGAPTSPALSNLVFFALDKKLLNYATKNNLIYSRYADDMVFSGSRITLNFKNFVIHLIKEYGFKVNSKKTKLKINASQNIITGIQIKDRMLFVPKRYKRELSKDLYYIKKFGIVSHVSKKRIKDPNYIYSLLGKINFVLNIEPNNCEYLKYKTDLESILM